MLGHELPNLEVLVLAAVKMRRKRSEEAVAVAEGTKNIAVPVLPVATDLLLDPAKAEH